MSANEIAGITGMIHAFSKNQPEDNTVSVISVAAANI
jgi:hypothetical protein